MKAIIQKSNKLSGVVLVPGSKSQTIRGLVFGLLAKGESILTNFLDCEDTMAAVRVCEGLGGEIKIDGNRIIIKSSGEPINLSRAVTRDGHATLNTGNSGITTRFILPVLGLRKNFNKPVILDCGKQMRARPIRPLVMVLNKLGMQIKFFKKSGQLPLSVSGQLIGGRAEVDGATSQYLSALLMSLPLAEKDSIISVKNLHERPYVEMTLKHLNTFGIKYTHTRLQNIDHYKIKGRQTYKYFNKQIPGDFSSASYLLAAGCLTEGKLVLKGLDLKDAQGDKRLVEILKQMGANISVSKSGVEVKGGKELKGIKIDANDIPDLLPTLAVIGTQAKGKTEIYNVKQARIKETDRIHSMTQGLREMGIKVDEHKDGMVIYPGGLKGAEVKGYNDHRTVMALTLAGLLAKGTTTIGGAQAVNKTFPEFYKLMKKFGANIIIKK